MPIYFTNPGLIDLEAALTLGVNAKLTDSPIGSFGTGLKYAIAVLLRTGHKVSIFCHTDQHTFSTVSKKTRETEYDLILLDGTPLGFTTALGKHWKVWQAFRELYSNALDEGGGVSDKCPSGTPTLGFTSIVVHGQEISQVYCDRWKYFLSPSAQPLSRHSNVEIHKGRNIYYKGILVEETPTAFAYNLTFGVTLTEDRTIGNSWSVGWDIARALQAQEDSKFLSAVLAKSTSPEHDYAWGSEFSDGNKTLLRKAAARDSLPTKFKGIADSIQVEEGTIAHRPSSADETSMLEKAKQQLKTLGVEVSAQILVSDKLPSDLLGLAKQGSIYLAGTLFAQGQTRVTGTVLEEHLHLAHGFADSSRRFQDYLIDLLAGAAAKLSEMTPLELSGELEAELAEGPPPYDCHFLDNIPF